MLLIIFVISFSKDTSTYGTKVSEKSFTELNSSMVLLSILKKLSRIFSITSSLINPSTKKNEAFLPPMIISLLIISKLLSTFISLLISSIFLLISGNTFIFSPSLHSNLYYYYHKTIIYLLNLIINLQSYSIANIILSIIYKFMYL